MPFTSMLLVASGGLAALLFGGLLTMLVFRIVDQGDEHASQAEGEPRISSEAERRQHSVEAAGTTLRGGAWIGALERLAIYGGLLAGYPEVIAIALAVKGLGRYPEIRSGENTAVAERFIIGTFVSVLWAASCAGVVHSLITR